MGATEPSMLQCAGNGVPAGFQTGALNVTAATGSPIASFGIDAPKLSTVQSASASFLAPVCPHKNPVAAQNTHKL